MSKSVSYKLVNLSAIVVLAVFCLMMLANSMLKPPSRDEQMYCTAGVLMSKGLLPYRDFSYIAQPPYHPLLYAAVFKLTGTTHYLLAARGLSVVFDCLIIFCIVSIFRKVFAPHLVIGTMLGIGGAALFVFNPVVDYFCGLAWNHDAVLLYIVLSFRLFLGLSDDDKFSILRIAAIAALLTIAVWTRATSAIIMLLFFAMLVSRFKFRYISAFIASAAVFSLWGVWVIGRQSRSFILNILVIPALNGRLLHKIGMAYDKIDMTAGILANEEYTILILATIFLWSYLFFCRKKLTAAEVSGSINTVLSLLLVAAFFIIVYIPATIWIQYFGPPVVFIIIALAFPLRYLLRIEPSGHKGRIHFRIPVMLILALTAVTIIRQRPIENIRGVLKISGWTPIQFHEISRDIVAQAKGSKQILTFSPLYALEGGGRIYTEFSAGPFACRVADQLSDSDKLITHTAGFADIEALLEKTPADLILIGPETIEFEKTGLEAVISPEWLRQYYEETGITIWLRPESPITNN
jgi:hypothetical protein